VIDAGWIRDEPHDPSADRIQILDVLVDRAEDPDHAW
jgi:hypothetical protein